MESPTDADRKPLATPGVTPAKTTDEDVETQPMAAGAEEAKGAPAALQCPEEPDWIHIYDSSPSHGCASLRSDGTASPQLENGTDSGSGGNRISEFGASSLGNFYLPATRSGGYVPEPFSPNAEMCKRGRFMSLPTESCVKGALRGLKSASRVTSPVDKSFYHSRCLSCPEEEIGKSTSRHTGPTCCHKRKELFLPLASTQSPDDALAAREKCRNALIAELKRRRGFLQVQLGWLQREVSAWNIFALVRACNTSELHYLLEQGLVDVDQRDYNGCTPLHVAALGGNESVVRILISFGADITAFDNTGRTPLDWAAENRHSSVCRLLVAVTKHIQMREHRHHAANAGGGNTTTAAPPNGGNTSATVPSAATVPLCNGASPATSCVSYASSKRGSTPQLTPQSGGQLCQRWGRRASPTVSPSDNVLFTALPPDMMAQYRARDCPNRAEGEGGEGVCEVSFDSMDGVTQTASSYTTVSDTVSLIVCMVGLPGRGKSFIGRRIARYLNWKGVPCRVFNVGSYRRKILGVEGTCSADFYNPQNSQARMMREQMAALASADLIHFIARHRVACGVFDATNTTKARRRYLLEYFERESERHNMNCKVIFIESVCNDPNLITENILRAKCGNDDFKNVKDTKEVISSFYSRIAEYEKVYEQVDVDEDISFIRIVNVKHHVVLHQLPCGLASLISFFLLNLHPVAHPIYIAVPGETVGDRKHIYGGDERLTPAGERFAEALKRFVLERNTPHMVVLHGTNPSVMNTLRPLEQALEGESSDDGGCTAPAAELLCPLPGLDSINFGRFCGRTVKQVRAKYTKLCRLLYAGSPMGSGSYVTADDEAYGGAGEGAQSDRPQRPKGQERHSNLSEVCAGGIRRFLHVPNGTDPRLSYCVQFPNGESCRQVNVRLEPALMAVMRVRGPVFVVASSVPAQGVLAFFADALPEMAPALRLPSHAVVEIGVKGDITVHQLEEPRGQAPRPAE